MRSLVVLLIISCSARSAVATPQLQDRVVFGHQTYILQEIPMAGLWEYGKESVGTGKQKPPDFDNVSSTNWTGYQAEFEIRDSKFWLSKIAGQIAGKQRKNEQIIPGERFPVIANWFTGRVNLEIGDFDYDTQEANTVIVFHVAKGIVTRTEFVERMQRAGTWNGVPRTLIPHEAAIAIQGIGTVPLPPGKWLLERVSNHQNSDIYMFEKAATRFERLSFQIYQGKLAASLNKHVDFTSAEMVNGIPRGVLKKDEGVPGMAQLIRPPVTISEQCLAATFISTADNGDPWINHVLVCNWKSGVLVCVHASPHVLSPDTVKNVYLNLKESSSK